MNPASPKPLMDNSLAVLAHELRSPLGALVNSLEIIRALCSKDATVDDAVHIMDRQLRYMTRLIQDVLDWTRADQGRLVLARENFHLNPVIKEAVETSRPALERRGQKLTVSLPAEPIYLNGDPTRMHQIVVNLLGNASRYSEDGGQIDFTVADGDGQRVYIKVRDNGAGIEPELLPHVFEPFSQGKGKRNGANVGLGIGLALVKHLVEFHGGDIEAHSPGAGRGTEFVACLPMSKSMQARQ